MQFIFPFLSSLPEATQIIHHFEKRNSSIKRNLVGSHLASSWYSMCAAQHFCVKEGLGKTLYLLPQRSMFILCGLLHFWRNLPKRPVLAYVWLVIGKGKQATSARKILAVSAIASSKQAKVNCFLLMYMTEVITVGVLS